MKRKKATKKSVLRALGMDYIQPEVSPLLDRTSAKDLRKGLVQHKAKGKDAVQAVFPW